MKEVIIYSPNVLVKFTLEMYVSMMAILTCYFTDFRDRCMLQWWPYLLVTLEMYVTMTAILTCYFRDVRYNDDHIYLLH